MQFLGVGLLAALVAFSPPAATAGTSVTVPGAASAAPAWQFSTSTLVHGAGALLGIGVYRYLVAPLAPPAGVAASAATSLATGPLAGAGLAALGAVGVGYAYDRWSGQPLDYAYLWTRVGAVAGFGLAGATAGWIGLPATAASWSAGWFGYRAFLGLGALAGSRAAWYWYGEPPAAPAQPAAPKPGQPPGG